MASLNQDAQRNSSGQSSRSAIVVILIIILIAMLGVNIYTATEISSLQSTISSLEQQNFFLQDQISQLQNYINTLAGEIPKILSISAHYECLTATPTMACGPNDVYVMYIYNNGTEYIYPTTSLYLSFNDTTSHVSFAFNTSLPQGIPVGQGIFFQQPSWPQSVSATAAKFAPGDSMIVDVWLGSFETSVTGRVTSCYVSGTTTFVNDSSTQTATLTMCTS